VVAGDRVLRRGFAAGLEHRLSYFGSANPAYYGIEYDTLPSLFVLDQRGRREDLFRLARLPLLEGTVAISATNLYGVYLESAAGVPRNYFARYRNREPTARIGHSIYVYQIDAAEAER